MAGSLVNDHEMNGLKVLQERVRTLLIYVIMIRNYLSIVPLFKLLKNVDIVG